MLETLHEFLSSPLESIVTLLNNPTIALWGPFIGLLLCGIGMPIPEDIILVAAGFLAGQNNSPVFPVIAVTYCGILIGDSIVFFIGAKLGRRVMDTRLAQKVLSPARLEKAVNAFHRYGIWVNFFGRFLPGFRTAIFFTGGTLKYPFTRFIAMDGLAALISAPLFVYIGHWAGIKFAENLDQLEFYIKRIKTYMGIGVLVLFLIFLLVAYVRSRRTKIAQS